jgi:hypothetical protein
MSAAMVALDAIDHIRENFSLHGAFVEKSSVPAFLFGRQVVFRAKTPTFLRLSLCYVPTLSWEKHQMKITSALTMSPGYTKLTKWSDVAT